MATTDATTGADGDAILIHWADVAIYADNGRVVDDPADQRRLMREYRRTGGISQHWLCDPRDADGDEEIDGVPMYEAGPAVADIDFAGVDAGDASNE